MPRIQTADITALIRERFQIKGRGSIDTLAPEIVATISVDPLIGLASLTPDVQEASVVIAAGSTIDTTTFSLIRRGQLTAWSITSTPAHQANVDWVELQLTDPAGAGVLVIHSTLGANAEVLTGEVAQYPNILRPAMPLFIPAGWDLRLRARTNAGGAATLNIDLLSMVEPLR